MLDPQSQGNTATSSTENTNLLPVQPTNQQSLTLSGKSKNLLRELEISENDITSDQAKIQALNAILEIDFWGKIGYLILNKSLSSVVKIPLLSFSVSRKNIIPDSVKVPQPSVQTIPASPANFPSSLSGSNQNSHSASSSSSDSSIALVLLSSSSSSEEIVLPEKEKNIFSEIWKKISYLSSPVLLQNEKALKKIVGLNDFHDTVYFIFEFSWNIFFISLLANGVINIGLYANQLPSSSDKIDYFLSVPNSASDTINGVLSRPWFYRPLISTPFVWGLLKGTHSYLTYKSKDISRALDKVLMKYDPGVIKDFLGWTVTAILPNLLPLTTPLIFCNIATPAILEYISCGLFGCGLLPQYKFREVLEKTKYMILWDGTLTKEKRLELFQKILLFKQSTRLLTYAYMLSYLSEFIKEINTSKLEYLKENGVDSESLMVLLEIKITAFQELYSLSHSYDSDNTKNTGDKSIFAYLYSNYLMGTAGYPQKWHGYISPPTYRILEYLSIGVLFYTLAMAAHPIIECRIEGKNWDYFEEVGKYICHVCGNFPIPFNEISTIQKCVNAFFGMPRTFEELVLFIDSFDLSNVESLDLTSQTESRINNTQLSILLQRLKPKLNNLKSLDAAFTNYIGSREAKNITEAIVKFIKNSKVANLSYGASIGDGCGDDLQYNLDIISNILPNTNILTLKLIFECSPRTQPPTRYANLDNLVKALKNSSVTDLSLSIPNIDDGNMRLLGEALTETNLLSLVLSKDVYVFKNRSNFCSSFSPNVVLSKINYLSISLDIIPYIDEDVYKCGKDFFCGLRNIDTPFGLQLTIPLINETGANFLAEIVSSGNLKSLEINTHTRLMSALPNFNVTNTIFKAINNSKLEEFGWSYIWSYDHDSPSFSILVDTLANSVKHSNLTKLKLNNFFPARPVWVKDRPSVLLFAKYLSSELSGLIFLDISSNGLSPKEVKAIADSLEKTNLHTLSLSGNISYAANDLGKALPKTAIKELQLRGSFSGKNDTLLLFRNIANSSLNVLEISGDCYSYNEDCIDESVINVLFLELPKSSLAVLRLRYIGITKQNIDFLSKQIVRNVSSFYLWPNLIENRKSSLITNTNISKLIITGVGDKEIAPICNILPFIDIDYVEFIKQFYFVGANFTYLEECGVLSIAATSEGSRLSIPLIYRIPYQTFMAIQNSAYSLYRNLNDLFYYLSNTSSEKPEEINEEIEEYYEELPDNDLMIDDFVTIEDLEAISTQITSAPYLRRFSFFSQQSEIFLPENVNAIQLPTEINCISALTESNNFENSNNNNASQAYLGMALMPGIGTMILSFIAIYLIYRALEPTFNSVWENRGGFFSAHKNPNLPEKMRENNQPSLQKK